ncbi:MAG: aminotransferase class I/II-fold pyridoxal phosphate-dependent enzyme [Bacteroidia bacterium]|nr:aminotransferase class I/II-fold pyridoxal phosphate-dependent enzyme [Bacteroidia bacterium]
MRFTAPVSVFARMTALAQKTGALNLAQGLMWMEPDPKLLHYSQRMMAETPIHQYSFPAGELSLRETVSKISAHFFGIAFDPEKEITITTGATEGIFSALLACTHPGRRVVFIEPAYDSYLPNIHLAGAVPVPVPLTITPEGISIPWSKIKDAIDSETDCLLLNFPHNPTGRCLHQEDLAELEQIAADFPQLCFIVDEAYELMTWHPDPFREEAIPPLSVRQSAVLRDRSVIVGSLGKMVGATGWRLGYILAPPPYTEAIRSVHQFVTFCAPTPLQRIVAHYLGEQIERATYFHRGLLQRRRACVELLQQHTSLEMVAPEGSYFVLFRIPEGEKDVSLAERLACETGVALIPLSPFYRDGYDPGWLRLCFARPIEMLKEAALRLKRAFPRVQPTSHPNE